MMKILIPIDVSDVSLNAIKYAHDVFPDAQMDVVHSITGLLNPNDPMVIKPWIPKDISIKEDLERMIREAFDKTKYPSDIKVEILFGETVPAIVRHVKKSDYDAIFMGTRDKYDLFDKWVGTNSLGVIKSVNVPVYLIPKFAKYGGYDKVVIASDRHVADPKMIDFVKEWNTDNAFLKFVHIRESLQDNFNLEEQKILQLLFGGGDPTFGFEVSVVDGKDVTKSLLSITQAEKADLLISVPEKQSFFQAMFFKSHTKKLVEQSNVPMLFLSKDAVDHVLWTNIIRQRAKVK